MATFDSEAQRCAGLIIDGFDRHYRRFRALSASAKTCFERSDWRGIRAASRERIGSYDARVSEAVQRLREEIPSAANEALWPEVKRALVLRLLDHQQPELVETFYNSLVCRVLQRRYFTNQYLFWRPQVSSAGIEALQPTWRAYVLAQLGVKAAVRSLITDLQLLCAWDDLDRDLGELEAALRAALPRGWEHDLSASVQVLTPILFRRHAAYVVGLVRAAGSDVPFVIALRKTSPERMAIEAFLTEPRDLAALTTLSRSYFMADMEVPASTVEFLRRVLPMRSRAELYTLLGLQKQGKTLFYRELGEHLRHTTDLFDVSAGVRGMVMCVFTLPSFPWVFKLIRDRFEPPKDADRAWVRSQYLRVKLHDRVGRMADTWEFSDVALPLSRFSPALLAELELKVPSLLERVGEQLLIKHLYIERRLTPLDLYLDRATPEERRDAIFEYGEAITELARTNIFPGDLLLKNFGVTRLGRVIFYDYDELAAVTETTFRAMPTARNDEDEYRTEFSVSPTDVFPEELPRFLFSRPEDLQCFLQTHGYLATAKWWQETQERLLRGEEADVRAFPRERAFQAHRT
ncbi:MAG: bifunctional isocitrate dehydrogenase kinase/phosphatase [Myxococcaceae bacterium]